MSYVLRWYHLAISVTRFRNQNKLAGRLAGRLPDELSGQRLAGRSVALLAASVCERLTDWMID
jgi:hypothetical protein